MSFNRPVQRQPPPGNDFNRKLVRVFGDYICETTDDLILVHASGATISLPPYPIEDILDVYAGASNITISGNGHTILGDPSLTIDLADLGHFIWDPVANEWIVTLHPAGSSASESVHRADFDWTTGSVVLGALAANQVLDELSIVVRTPFNGTGPTVRVGTGTNPTAIFAAGEVDLTRSGTFQNPGLLALDAPDSLLLDVLAPGASQGRATLLYKVAA